MRTLFKIGLTAVAFSALLASLGCSAADVDEGSTETTAQALGERCTVTRDPPYDNCPVGSFCSLSACTNSIPPTCTGTCRPVDPPVKSECTGAFNCLCGTPTCVDGEWTCVGSCGDGERIPSVAKPRCTGAFNCLCGTPACIDGEWTCIGSCGGPVE
jgi:hypothetical protein